jgi:hypothetical protein
MFVPVIFVCSEKPMTVCSGVRWGVTITLPQVAFSTRVHQIVVFVY